MTASSVVPSHASKVRVAHIITRMDWGGAPDIVRMLCEGLDPERFDVTLIIGKTCCASAKTQLFFARFKPRIIVVPALVRNINPLLDCAALIALYRLCVRHRYDIVHTHTAKAGMLGRIAAYCAGIRRIVHTPHGHNFYGYFNAAVSRLIIALERGIASLTTTIVCLTRLEKEDHVRFRIAPESKLTVIATAVERCDVSAEARDIMRTQLTLDDQDIVVGMVGRLEAVKGADIFVRAALDICRKHAQVKIFIVGEGSMRSRLQEQIQREGLSRRFIFTGWRDDAPVCMALMDMMVLASRNEAVGLVLLEAQMLGIPVIATRVGGIPEIIEHGVSGLLVPPDDVPALAQAIEVLLRSPAQRAALSAAAGAFIEKKFSAQGMIQSMAEHYETLL